MVKSGKLMFFLQGPDMMTYEFAATTWEKSNGFFIILLELIIEKKRINS